MTATHYSMRAWNRLQKTAHGRELAERWNALVTRMGGDVPQGHEAFIALAQAVPAAESVQEKITALTAALDYAQEHFA